MQKEKETKKMIVFNFFIVLVLLATVALAISVDATPTASRNKQRQQKMKSKSPSTTTDELGDFVKNSNNLDTTTNNDISSSSSNTNNKKNKTDKTVVTSIDEEETASSSMTKKEEEILDTTNPNLVASKPNPHETKIEAGVLKNTNKEHSHSHSENLPHDHPLMMPSTHPDAAFQADHRPKSEKLDLDDKTKAMNDIVEAQKEKRTLEKKRHPAASQQYVELHGQRVSVASLQQMCDNLRKDHLPFLRKVASRELELSVLFAANRLSSLFDGHLAEKRLGSVEQISCPHGIQLAKSAEADKLFKYMQELIKEQEGIRLHLLDLADAWTMTQSKDSDLVEEVVASLSYYSALSRVGNDLNQKLSFLRTHGSVRAKNCQEMVQDLAKLVRHVPEGVPNWTHMKVGAEMLIHQCGLEPSLANDDL